MHPPKSHAHAVMSATGIAASLLAAVAIHLLATDGEQVWDVVAGWLAAICTFLIGHLFIRRSKKCADQPLFALGAINVRLFSLILVFLVVLVGDFFEAVSFATGMLCGYLAACWIEIGGLVRGVHGQKQTFEKTTWQMSNKS